MPLCDGVIDKGCILHYGLTTQLVEHILMGRTMQILFSTDEELEEQLTRPNSADIEAAKGLEGDVLVLGAGGKMGPSLVVRIKRAIQKAGLKHRIIAVVRKDRERFFAAHRDGVDLIETDLLDPKSYRSLPGAPNVIFMAGRKFGSTGEQSLTWATNVWMASLVADSFRNSRIVAFSTGNVYPFVAADGPAPTEQTPPSPIGEYAQSTLGRERIFEYFASKYGTSTLIYRLNYAVDLRYGVLVDIAQKVLRGEAVNLTTGYVNVIWQGDANSYCLRSFALASSPARVLNVTGLQRLSVRELALQFAEHFGKKPIFTGVEAETALLSDASRCIAELGPPEVRESDLIEMTASWLSAGGATLGKPTKFESRDGKF